MIDWRRSWLVLLVFCRLCRGAWAEETITRIRLGLQPESTRIVLDLSEPTAYRVGLLADPDRLYIELPPAVVTAALPQQHGLIRNVTLSQGAGLLRLVAYLRTPVTVTRADLIA